MNIGKTLDLGEAKQKDCMTEREREKEVEGWNIGWLKRKNRKFMKKFVRRK